MIIFRRNNNNRSVRVLNRDRKSGTRDVADKSFLKTAEYGCVIVLRVIRDICDEAVLCLLYGLLMMSRLTSIAIAARTAPA